MLKILIPLIVLGGLPRLMWCEEKDQYPSSEPIKIPIYPHQNISGYIYIGV